MDIQLEIWPVGQKIRGCDTTVDSRFLHFVDSYNDFLEESILSVASDVYKIDLLPLSKLVYLSDEPDKDEITEVIQNSSDLISLAEKLIVAVKRNPAALDGKSYTAYDDTFSMLDDEVLDFLDESTVSFFMDGFKSSVEESRKLKAENPFPWNSYFSELEIVADLQKFIDALKCLKSKGVENVYLVGA